MVPDERYMQRCLDLAILGAGTVSPNPMVGAVILHEGFIIGEGYTSPYGGSHAEVNAVQDAYSRWGETEAKQRFRTATMYVSLEPCAHYGKTPPCADMLAELQFECVVIGCLDPFAKVNGQGLERLKQARIATRAGVLEEQCRAINKQLFTNSVQKRPYVILSWAQAVDGVCSPDEEAQRGSRNKAIEQRVHKCRSVEDEILVDTTTAMID